MKPLFLLAPLLVLAALQAPASAQMFSLGTAQNFAVLGGATVTNTGTSSITGSIGVSPGTALTGFPTGTIFATPTEAAQARSDTATAYNALATLTPTQDLSGQNMGGRTLQPGVYRFSSAAPLAGTLTLDALGQPDALFVFQIGTTLTTATASAVQLTNGGSPSNIFWQVGTSATIGNSTAFVGSVLASQSITVDTGATLFGGRVLAGAGAVTLDTNRISTGNPPPPSAPAGGFAARVSGSAVAPEPGTLALVGTGLMLGGAGLRRRRGMRV